MTRSKSNLRGKRSGLIGCAVLALGLGSGLAWAGDEIDIERANWSSDRDTLTVRGDNAPDNAIVTIRYGEKDDNGAMIDTTQADGDGDWEFRISDLNPVPCEVTAQAAGSDDDDKEVRRAPNNCSNDGGVVQPPQQVCNIAVSPTTLAFGDITVGNSPTLSTTVSNSGDAACGVSLARNGSTDFAIASMVSFSVAPGGSASVSVSYTPGQVGGDSDTLAVNSNDPDTATVNVALTGNGVQQQVQECNIAVSPLALNFGNVNLGNSPTLSTTVSNSGAAACNVNLVRTGSNDFDITSAASFNVAPGGSQNVPVSYTPGQVGADTGNVAVNSDDPDTPTVNVGLSGNGVDNVPPVACVETPGDGPQTHADCITSYTGPEVCVECHEGQARDMHSSVHYQQGGAFPNVTNVDPGIYAAAGERPAHNAAFEEVATGVNTYCGTHENSPRFTCAGCHVGNGRFPKTPDEMNFPTGAFQFEDLTGEQQEELSNIDCLMCHQDAYKRFPDPAGGFETLVLQDVTLDNNDQLVEALGQTVERLGLAGIPIVADHDNDGLFDFQFVPADPTNPDLADIPAGLMVDLTADTAAQKVHRTHRTSCLNCHAGAGGGDGTKRGDLSKDLNESNNPGIDMDVHMSSQGGDFTCARCHDAGGHRVVGRGLDLRPNDVAEPLNCVSSSCHNNDTTPHVNVRNSGTLNRHTDKVACQTCHIPTYAKGGRDANGNLVGTEVARDWLAPHVSQTACNGRGGWLPNEIKASNLVPTYTWFDGKSQVSYLGEQVDVVPTKSIPDDPLLAGFTPGDQAYVIGAPDVILTDTGEFDETLGVSMAGAKIYPMKEHWGKLARNDRTGTLVGHSTFEFFRTGDYGVAVRSGMEQDPAMNADDPYTVVPVHTYQTLNHGVETGSSVLGANDQCSDCHGSTARMDLQADLGYELKDDASVVCSQCHEFKSSKGFVDNHRKHVEDKGKDCSVCHTFSRPERGLSTAIDN